MLTVFLYIIYYCAVLGGMIALSFIFQSAVIFDLTSAVPILVSALMLWQAYSLHKNHAKLGTDDEKQMEINDYIRCVSHSYLVCTPLCFPMIFFLSSWGKSISILPFLIAIIAGGAVYKKRKRARDTKKLAKEEKGGEE